MSTTQFVCPRCHSAVLDPEFHQRTCLKRSVSSSQVSVHGDACMLCGTATGLCCHYCQAVVCVMCICPCEQDYFAEHGDAIAAVTNSAVFLHWPKEAGAAEEVLADAISGMDTQDRSVWAHALDPSIPTYEQWGQARAAARNDTPECDPALFDAYLDEHYTAISDALCGNVFRGWPRDADGNHLEYPVRHGMTLLMDGLEPQTRIAWAHALEPSIPTYEAWAAEQRKQPATA